MTEQDRDSVIEHSGYADTMDDWTPDERTVRACIAALPRFERMGDGVENLNEWRTDSYPPAVLAALLQKIDPARPRTYSAAGGAMTPEQSERAAIVAWLRNGADCYMPEVEWAICKLADAIERGDHLSTKGESNPTPQPDPYWITDDYGVETGNG